jgi:hypothetical protein
MSEENRFEDDSQIKGNFGSRTGAFYSPEIVAESDSVRKLMWAAMVCAVLLVLTTVFTFWFLPGPCIIMPVLLIITHIASQKAERVLRSCSKEEGCSQAHRAYSLNVWLIIWSVVAAVGLMTAWILIGIPILILAAPFVLVILAKLFFIWLKVENALEEIQEKV